MKRDQKFFDMYSVVIGLLAIFALAIFVLSMKMSSLTQDIYSANSAESLADVAERLAPVGTVYLPGDELNKVPQVPVVASPAPEAAELTGAQVYNQSCNVCHGAGIGGAPVLTNVADWQPRLAQGADVLKLHAIDGYSGGAGFMPPKGGNLALSDNEVGAAVDFMIGKVKSK